jgi:hypothetical protein
MKEPLNTLILAVAILLAVTIYCFGTRYQIVGTGTHGMGLQVDRMTGETWWLLLEKKVKQKQEEGLKQEEMAPRKTKWE